MFSPPTCLDVAVVGGGPAGASCAVMLARAGVRVGLIDRATPPVKRVESVSGRARRLLQQHCPEFSERATPSVEIEETVSLWTTPEPVIWNAMLNPWGAALAVERTSFDANLREAAQHAGAWITRAEIKSASRRGSRWELVLHHGGANETLRAEFMVVATGSAGCRFINRKTADTPTQFALLGQLGTAACARGTMYLELATDGWWYALPNPFGGYCAGFCVDQLVAANWKKPLRDRFLVQLKSSRLIATLAAEQLRDLTAGSCAAGPRRHEQLTGAGWVAIGDAAFTLDPLSGKGIEFAIESAAVAVEALFGHRPQSLANYTKFVKDYAADHERVRSLHLPAATPAIHQP